MDFNEYLSKDYEELVKASKKITGNSDLHLDLLHYSIEEMSNLPANLRKKLGDEYEIQSLFLDNVIASQVDGTSRYFFKTKCNDLAYFYVIQTRKESFRTISFVPIHPYNV